MNSVNFDLLNWLDGSKVKFHRDVMSYRRKRAAIPC